MRNIYKYLLISLASIIYMMPNHASATTMPHDTIYFYESWKQMLEVEPVAMVVDPIFDIYSSGEIYLETGMNKTNDLIREKYIAFSLGDSLWYMNTEYIKKNFSGDTKNMNGFCPVFFNEKVAYVVSNAPLSFKNILFGTYPDGITEIEVDNYHLDFLNHRVKRVTPEYLVELLGDYHNLQMRYEGMKNYKKHEIIEDYFFKFIDQATDDIMRPNIIDLTK